jgi:hypothetical protein
LTEFLDPRENDLTGVHVRHVAPVSAGALSATADLLGVRELPAREPGRVGG